MNVMMLILGVVLVALVLWFFMHVSIVRSYGKRHGHPMSAGEASRKVLRDMKRVFIDGKKPEMLLPAQHGSHHVPRSDNPITRGIPSVTGHGPGKRPAKRAKQRKRG